MNPLICNTLFSGIRGSDVGLAMAGFTPQLAFEIDADLNAIGERNCAARGIVADICDIDFNDFSGCDVLSASPVCKNASIAKSGGVESDVDIATAKATVRAIEAWRPRGFILENVWGYRNFEAFLLICEALNRLGYRFGFWHLCAADFGVPQTRRRLILIATRSKGGRLMPPPPTHSKEGAASLFGGLERWVGWYEAVADLIGDLPETEFAPWQLERLGAMPEFSVLLPGDNASNNTVLREQMPCCTIGAMGGRGNAPKAFLVGDQNNQNRHGGNPSFTVCASDGAVRAFVTNGTPNDRGQSLTVRNGASPMFTVTSQTGERQPARAFIVHPCDMRDMIVRSGNEPSFTILARLNPTRAFIVDGDAGGERPPTVRAAHEPCTTVKSSTGGGAGRRAQLESGRVVAMNTRCLARFQSFPDSYELSGNRKLDTTGIGNAVPPLLARAVGEHLKTLL